jgi:polyadenylate-binding protein
MTKTEREQMLRAKFKSTAGNQPVGVNLYIKNLPDDADDAALREMFAPFGEITSAKVMQDTNKRSKGFGFVCYKTPDEATKAVSDMHLKTIKGKPLYVGLAEKKDERTNRLAQRYKGEKGAPAGAMMGPGGMPGQKGMPGGFDPSKGGKGAMQNPMMGQQYGQYPMNPQMAAQKGMNAMPMQQNQQMMMNGMRPGMQGGFGGPGPMQNVAQQRPGMMPGMYNQQMNPMMKGMPQQMAGHMGPGQKGFAGQMGPGMMGPGMVQNPAMQGKGMMPGQQGAQMRGPMQGGMMPGQGAMPGMPAQNGAPGQQMLTPQALAQVPQAMQKQMLGEKLYPAVSRLQPDLAGKITGMMLEMDNNEVLMMLENEGMLRQKVDEAVRVLNQMK